MNTPFEPSIPAPEPTGGADEALMRRALELATRGPANDPNPRVGCVITDAAGEVVGAGWHRGAGTAHAEVAALTEAGTRARGGTAYVTLEPCRHTGRTGPCAPALIEAGIGRVVYAVRDPNPQAGGGALLLRQAGIDVTGGVLAAEGTDLVATWLYRMRTGRPWVTWKFAASLDGRSSAADGTSQWITGLAARADVHALRARCGAVIVGTGTALADDPALTARDSSGQPVDRQPVRVVVGISQLPVTATVFDGSAETLIFPSRDIAHVLTSLGERGIHHALLEGGPTLAAAFVAAGLIDEVVAYVAPVLIGAGAASVADLGVSTITEALRLTPTDIRVVGEDIRITATWKKAA